MEEVRPDQVKELHETQPAYRLDQHILAYTTEAKFKPLKWSFNGANTTAQ